MAIMFLNPQFNVYNKSINIIVLYTALVIRVRVNQFVFDTLVKNIFITYSNKRVKNYTYLNT